MARSRSGDKQSKIVQAALQSFAEHGIAKTTMQAVADKAGIAVGTLYLYYKDKDDLVSSCADFFAHQHQDDAEIFSRSEVSSRELLIEYHRKRYSEWQKLVSPQLIELTLAIIKLRPDKVADDKTLVIRTTETLISRGIDRGEFAKVSAWESSLNVFIALTPFFRLPDEKTLFEFDGAHFESYLIWLMERVLPNPRDDSRAIPIASME